MKKLLVIIISLVMVTSLAFSEESYDSKPENFKPKYYDNAKVLRVKFTQGESYVRRSYDEGVEEATINLPVFEKDLVGTTDGRTEVYLGRLNYMRLDIDTEVMIDKAPELRKTDLTLRLTRGGIYLDIDSIDFERDIEVQTPDCGVFILSKGVYRVNVTEGGKTEVYVFDGMAQVSGTDYNREVRENQKIVMLNGQVKERPFNFYSSDEDEFDRWNRSRNNLVGYARYGSSRYLEPGYEDYEYELSREGRWVYSTTYNTNIWIPYNVAADWRPYYHGRWVWHPHYGYVWTSYDSWGYFTHHYGRWHWDPVTHWCWVPGYHWSPAWVSWWWDNDYYGWCPLSWWNRPVIIIDGHWHHHYHYWRGIPHHSRSTTIIRKHHLSTAGIHRVAILRTGDSRITKKTIAFRGYAPSQPFAVSKVKVMNARGEQVLYKENGVVSQSKYKVLNPGTSMVKPANDATTRGTIYQYSGRKLTNGKITKYSTSPTSPTTSPSIKSYSTPSSVTKTDRPHVETRGSTDSNNAYQFKSYKAKNPANPSYRVKTKSSSSGYQGSSGSSGSSSYKPKSSTGIKSQSSKIKKKKDEPYEPGSNSYNGYSSFHSEGNNWKRYGDVKRPSSSYKNKQDNSPSSSYRGSTSSYKPAPSFKSYRPSGKSSYTPSVKTPSFKSSGSSYRSGGSSSRSSRSVSSSSRSSSRGSSSSSSSVKKKNR